MKTFLTTMKGKIIAGVATLGVIGTVVVVILVLNSGYRTIAVEQLNGITQVINAGAVTDAYVGQHLKSGDDVTVSKSADLTLALDTDKYMYAKESTHFWIEAAGKIADTRTKIHLDEGSTLCRIDNKLHANETFDVETPNATMSVRGTVFRTSCYKDGSNDTYTVVDVLEGAVFVQVNMENGQKTEESRLLTAGERAIIRSNTEIAEFLKSEDEEKEELVKLGIYGAPGVIDYVNYTQEEARFLGRAIDDGRKLSIGKELLFDYVGLIEHDFSIQGEEVAATCDEEGYYYDICAICGAEGEKHTTAEVQEHVYETKEGDDSILICKHCGEEVQNPDVKAEDNETDAEEEEEESRLNASSGNRNSSATSPTLTQEALEEEETNQEEELPAETPVEQPAEPVQETTADNTSGNSGDNNPCAGGHSYEVYDADQPTCTTGGKIGEVCTVCWTVNTTFTSSLGHTYTYVQNRNGSHSMQCTRCGYSENQACTPGAWVVDADGHASACSVCGDTLVPEEGHDSRAGEPAPGEIGHYPKCSVCGYVDTTEMAECILDNNSNGKCIICNRSMN